MAETRVIEVRVGRAEPAFLELRPGVELAPLSVGAGGAWQVSATGVRLVHLYLYFDGQTLFVQSAEETDPPAIDGEPVPSSWTPAPNRCTITFGQARLAFHPADEPAELEDDEDRTIAQQVPEGLRHDTLRPIPGEPAPVTRPFDPGAFAGAFDDESTRLHPVGVASSADDPPSEPTRIERLQLPEGLVPPDEDVVRPAAGSPWAHAATVPGLMPAPEGFPIPTGFGPPAGDSVAVLPADGPRPGELKGAPPGLLDVPPPPPPQVEENESAFQKLRREWAAAPPLRKGLFAAMPLAIVAAVWIVFGEGPAAPARPVSRRPPTSSSASTSTSTPAAAVAPPPVAPSATSWPAPEPVNPGLKNTGTSLANAPEAAAASCFGADVGPAGADHRERQAADFVATHAYDQAIRIYEQLAAERPQNPAFHEAARILRGKVEAGAP